MRGPDTFTESLFTQRKLEDFVPADHPLCPIRQMVNATLIKMDDLFSVMYQPDIKGGRPNIVPEKLMRAMPLQVFYSIRSERQLMEQTQYGLLFRWSIGLIMDDSVWVPMVFTKNRERLIKHDAVIEIFNQVPQQAQARHLLLDKHFIVDGTLIQAWASHKSFVSNSIGDTGGESGKADTTDFQGEKRSNASRHSSIDGDARLYRKGENASRLRYMGYTLCDNRHGLIATAMVTTAGGYAEREVAKVIINHAVQAAPNPEAPITLGVDKADDNREFIETLQEIKVIPHVAQNNLGRRSAVPDAVSASADYAISIQKRKLIELCFGRAKTVGRIRQVMVRGLKRVDQMFALTMAACKLTRMHTLGQTGPRMA